MALIEIEYGSLASSDVMNRNFMYLDDRISTVSGVVDAYKAGVNSTIASLNSSITNMNSELNSNINQMNLDLNNAILNKFSENGLYISTFRSGVSWYKEYFSDVERATRVWLEQGGLSNAFQGDSRLCNVTYLKSFTQNDYSLIGVAYDAVIANSHASWIHSKDEGGATFANAAGGVRVSWYACGV